MSFLASQHEKLFLSTRITELVVDRTEISREFFSRTNLIKVLQWMFLDLEAHNPRPFPTYMVMKSWINSIKKHEKETTRKKNISSELHTSFIRHTLKCSPLAKPSTLQWGCTKPQKHISVHPPPPHAACGPCGFMWKYPQDFGVN